MNAYYFSHISCTISGVVTEKKNTAIKGKICTCRKNYCSIFLNTKFGLENPRFKKIKGKF